LGEGAEYKDGGKVALRRKRREKGKTRIENKRRFSFSE
jgi:hypothetical protein